MTKKIAKQILTTRGVNSCVHVDDLDDSKLPGKRFWTELHVGLHDFDDVGNKADILNRVMDEEGINILWMSSKNPGLYKYHHWNLTCKTVSEIALNMMSLAADCKHISHGYRRQKWVLRIVGKIRDGVEYKPAPKMLHTWCNPSDGVEYKPAPKMLHTWCNPSDRPQSLPHLRLFEVLTGKTIECKEVYDYVGRTAQFETYMTMTDEMKKIVANGGK